MNKTCTKHKIVLELLKTHQRGSLFPIGEVCPLLLYAEQGRFEYHPASKDRTHVDPLRTRHKDVVFASGGGGGLLGCASPNPPAFFSSRAEHRTMNKTCIKHKTVLELFKAHHKGVLFAKEGASLFYCILCYSMLCYAILCHFKLQRIILKYRTARTVTRTLTRTITLERQQ